jgi:type II secretion system protein G
MAKTAPLDYAPRTRAEWSWPRVVVGVSLSLVTVATWAFRFWPADRGTMARRVAAKVDVTDLLYALDSFESDNGCWPTASEGLAALIQQPAGLPSWKGPYVRPRVGGWVDPWANSYVYTSPAEGSTAPVVMSLGPDGKAGTGDDIVPGP